MDISTTYLGKGGYGGVSTNTDATPYMQGNDSGLLDLARRMMRKRLAEKPALAPVRYVEPQQPRRMGGLNGPAPAQQQPKHDPMDERPPMKWVYPGGQPVLTMDVDAMTARQRQMFLPQNSTNNPAADAAANASQQQQQDQEFGAIDEQHRRADEEASPSLAAQRQRMMGGDPYALQRQRQINAGYGSY